MTRGATYRRVARREKNSGNRGKPAGLLPQPGGFEGFGPTPILLVVDELAVADREDWAEVAPLDLNAALGYRSHVLHDDHAVASREEFLEVNVEVLPGNGP